MLLVACFVLLLFLRFRSVFFYLAERMPARGWLREWLFRARLSFWAICIRLGATARICYRLLLKTQSLFLWIAVSSLCAPRRAPPFWCLAALRGCVRETGRTARPASAWAAAAMTEVKDDEVCAFLHARATTYLVII